MQRQNTTLFYSLLDYSFSDPFCNYVYSLYLVEQKIYFSIFLQLQALAISFVVLRRILRLQRLSKSVNVRHVLSQESDAASSELFYPTSGLFQIDPFQRSVQFFTIYITIYILFNILYVIYIFSLYITCLNKRNYKSLR